MALALDGEIEPVLGVHEIALLHHPVDRGGLDPEAELHAGRDDRSVADEAPRSAAGLIEQVLELRAHPLEARRRHVGDIVGDHLDMQLLGIMACAATLIERMGGSSMLKRTMAAKGRISRSPPGRSRAAPARDASPGGAACSEKARTVSIIPGHLDDRLDVRALEPALRDYRVPPRAPAAGRSRKGPGPRGRGGWNPESARGRSGRRCRLPSRSSHPGRC